MYRLDAAEDLEAQPEHRVSHTVNSSDLVCFGVSMFGWLQLLAPPEGGGEAEGSAGLGAPQLRQVLGLQLHHHIVEPAIARMRKMKLEEKKCGHLSFLPQPMNLQTCSRPCSFFKTAT